jgi:hypothetical protein
MNLTFLKTSLIFILALSGLVFSNVAHGSEEDSKGFRKNLLTELVRQNDEAVTNVLMHQWTSRDNKYYGAVFNGDSVVTPIGTAGMIETLMCSYVSPGSKGYRSREILDRMIMAAEGLLNLQHEDGTIDLLSTNFHSTPDLGFAVYPVALAYSIMLQNKQLEFGNLGTLLREFLLNAGRALSTGGVHTPNHRWVVSGALAWIHSFFPDPVYKSRILQWLAEKIDIDPDGQYHERSTAVYTPVTNNSLIDIARKMGMDEIYEAVRKNLDMTFYYVRSNGEIATESSNRQDKFQQSNMSRYFHAYNFMALLDKNGRYAGMTRYISETVTTRQLAYMLPYLLEDPSLLAELPEAEPLPERYHKHFPYSDIVRIRDGNTDMSVITGNTTFFTFFRGEAALEAVRLASAFFGKGQFQSSQMEKDGDTYILSSVIYGPYYQPLPKEKIPQEGESWGQVSRIEREQSEIQTLLVKIFITPQGKKALVRVVVDGPENLPVSLELAFREGGTFEGVTPKKGATQTYLPGDGDSFSYTFGRDTIRVGPGKREHNWTQLRGALPKIEAESVYFTAYGPCEFNFTIE